MKKKLKRKGSVNPVCFLDIYVKLVRFMKHGAGGRSVKAVMPMYVGGK